MSKFKVSAKKIGKDSIPLANAEELADLVKNSAVTEETREEDEVISAFVEEVEKTISESEESEAVAESTAEASMEPEEPKAEEPETVEEEAFEDIQKSDEEENHVPFIEFRNVKKKYIMGETEIDALAGVDFTIEKGECVIVVGASGAGKTTILNILGGMDTLTSGKVLVDGNEVSTYSQKEMILYRRYDVGFVFQFYNLVQNLTARENVELASQVSKDPLDIDATIEAVGLTERKNNFPSQLSGGEQQRVAIARALAKNPKLLLCDEPTGALDYNTGKQILKLLQDTARENGMTVIIITHNYALTSIGDRVIKVKNGRIESVTRNDNPMDISQVEW